MMVIVPGAVNSVLEATDSIHVLFILFSNWT
jgi:hypothetical protein